MGNEINAAEIAGKFSRGVVEVKPLSGGNINETFLAKCVDGSRFILQRISSSVFPHPEAIVHNLHTLGEHAKRKFGESGGDGWKMPILLPTLDGRDCVTDSAGECWRALSFIANATAWTQLQDISHAREVGYALGRYQSLLSDLPADALEDTLPGYHVTPGYLRAFDQIAATAEAKTRADGDPDCLAMFRFIESERPRASLLEDALARGELKLRPIHGDPKVSNVMIDDTTRRAVAMIDLDTTKPGLIHYDFGDCVRSACNPAGEEPEDPRAAHIDVEALCVVASGYLKCANGFLTDADRALLYDSVRMIAFELSLRFFADYLDGSRYFRVSFPRHNLRRATVQRILCENIIAKEGAIRKIIDGIAMAVGRGE